MFLHSFVKGMASHELRIQKQLIENKEHSRQSVELVCFEDGLEDGEQGTWGVVEAATRGSNRLQDY